MLQPKIGIPRLGKASSLFRGKVAQRTHQKNFSSADRYTNPLNRLKVSKSYCSFIEKSNRMEKSEIWSSNCGKS
jgi:hypothetical protein